MNRKAILSYLEWYEAAGVDETIGNHPVDRYQTLPPARSTPAAVPEPRTPRPQPPVPQSRTATEHSAREAAAAASNLEELHDAFMAFEGCGLKTTAKRFVFADGNPDARLMFVGEAPGAEEDRAGLPFVGPAGRLLDKMLQAIDLDRSQVYISNIVPWRPPGNRTPTPAEIAACLPFLHRHVALAAPGILLTLGGPATATLLNTPPDRGITRLRGNWLQFTPPEAEPIPAMPLLHPAYLLRQPAQKRLAWQDFLKIRQWLNENPS